MSHGDASFDAAIRAVAAEAAPDLWREALAAARAEVLAELTPRLATALRALLASGGGDATPPAAMAEPAGDPQGGIRPASADPSSGPGRNGSAAGGTPPVKVAPQPAPVAPGPARSPGAGEEAAGSLVGLYLYGFTHAGAHEVSGLRGVDGADTFAITDGPVRAIVSEARGARNGWGVGGDGEPDLTELAPRLRQHEQVLQAVLARGGVLPVRFGTLYPTREAVVDLLRSRGDAVHAALGTLDGKAEWGLTIRWDADRLRDGDERPAAVTGDEEPSGRSYLGRVAKDRAQAERVADRRRELADRLHRALTAAADDGVVLPPRRGDSGRDDILLRASYLVADDAGTAFQEQAAAELAGHADLDVSGELTGPWPAYHFARLELEGAGV